MGFFIFSDALRALGERVRTISLSGSYINVFGVHNVKLVPLNAYYRKSQKFLAPVVADLE